MDSVLYQIGKDIGQLQTNIDVLAEGFGKRVAALEQHAAQGIAAEQQDEREDIGRKLAELEELKRRVAEFEAKDGG